MACIPVATGFLPKPAPDELRLPLGPSLATITLQQLSGAAMLRILSAFVLLAGIAITGCNKSSGPGGSTSAKTSAGVAVNKVDYDAVKLTADIKAANTADKRVRVIQKAVEMDANGENVVPALLKALEDKTAGTLGRTSERPNSSRETAVMALLELKEKGRKGLHDSGLKTLENGLKDKEPNVREHTVNAIGMIGPDAKSSAEAVAKLCTDKEKEVRAAAYRTLEKMKNVPSLPIVKLLNNPNLDIAGEAAAALKTWLKPTGPENIGPLIDAVKRKPRENEEPSDVRFVKNAAAEALANVGKGAEEAIPELVDLLLKANMDDVEQMLRPMKEGDNSSNIVGPVLALRRIGKAAVPAVTPLLKHNDALVRYQAAAVLSGMSLADGAEALPQVQEAMELERGLPTGQMYVFEELAAGAINLGGDKEKITRLVIELLKSEEEAVRYRAAKLLARAGRAAAPAVPRLMELLNDANEKVQLAAVEALAAVGPAAKDAVIEIGKKAEVEDPIMARAAAIALKNLGTDAVLAIPSLCKALDSNDHGVCLEAAKAIAAVGADGVGAVEAIVKHLNDDASRREERLALLDALTAIGPPAKDAIPAVNKLAEMKSDGTIRGAAVETLAVIGIGDPAAIKKLGETLKDSQMSVRLSALRGLAIMGPKAAAAAPDVKAMFDQTKDASAKVATAATLAALGSNADANAKVVLDALKDRTPAGKSGRVAAIDFVEFLGPKGRPAVPELIEALKDKSLTGRPSGGQVRERAAKVLGRMASAASAAIRPLTDALKDSERGMREAAADALGMFGPDAVVAAPKLREMIRVYPESASIAQMALDRIEPMKKTD